MGRISAAEIASLARFRRRLAEAGRRGVMAHLVAVEGSHYRRPGARMIFGEDGSSVGSISGGCLEADLAGKCAAVLSDGRPRLVEYDLRGSDDVVWGTGLGCAGRVEILLSPLAEEDLLGVAAAIGEEMTIATVLDGGAFDRGEQTLFSAGKRVGGSARLGRAVASGKTLAQRVLIETMEPSIRLLIGGAGPDVVPLAAAARAIGWDVRVFSPRPTEKGRSRFADFPFLPAEEIAAHASPRAAALVATHNYFDDLDILGALVPTRLPYVGLLGARARVARLIADSRDVAGETAASRIFGPAGLDLGAETPEEIALSIVAEIQAVLSGRRGGSLRDSETSIHDREAEGSGSSSGRGAFAAVRPR